MAIYVLVSGAWHGGWWWERVVPLLEAAGHTALAPDPLGMGSDVTPLDTVTLAGWADQIAAIVQEQQGPVILVGHSRGGIIISAVAERVPDNIRSLVYLAAFLVAPGETLRGTSFKGERTIDGQIITMRSDGTSVVVPEKIGPTFYNTTDPVWIERVKTLLSPEPMAVLVTPLEITAERFGRVPRAYIECTQDRAVPLVLQRLMQQALPCDPVFTMESDHSPAYSDPDGLAAHLLSLA